MFLLQGQSLARADWFRPESQSLNLEERRSTSTLTVGPDAPEIAVGAWLEDDEDPGKGIVWRVRSVETQYETNTRTVQLEHIVQSLNDLVMFGEVTPKTITGNNNAATCTPRQAVDYILGQTNLWTLDTSHWSFGSVSGKPYSFNGETLYAALETVTGSLADAYWRYDLTAIPFKIGIVAENDTVTAEMRMERNIQTLRRTVDRSRMYTRLYPIGANNLHIDGNYVSQNEGVYGTICKVETDQGQTTKAGLLAWAQERIARHCEPTVTVTVSGADLSLATGVGLDSFEINRKCRIPLPEFGTSIVEKVTKLAYPDKLGEPQRVTVTLANNPEDVASIIRRETARSSRSGRAKAKQEEEDHAWFVDTTDHVAMVAEALLGPDEDGVDWSRVATLIVDGEGIHAQVKKAGTDAEGANAILSAAGLDIDENGALMYTDDFASGLGSRMVMDGSSWGVFIEGTGQNAHIKPAAIQAAIDAATSSSKISLSADKVEIDGELIAGNITADDDITCGELTCTGLTVSGEVTLDPDSPVIPTGGSSDYTLGDMIVYAEVDSSTNTLKLWSLADAGSSTPTISFSKAASGNYSLSGIWSSAAFPLVMRMMDGTTVVDSKSIGFTSSADYYLTIETNGTPTEAGTTGKYINVPYKIVEHPPAINGVAQAEQIRGTGSLALVNASGIYGNGWDDAVATIGTRAAAAGNNDIVIKTLDYDQKWKITFFFQDKNGNEQTRDYIVKAPAEGSGDTPVIDEEDIWDDAVATIGTRAAAAGSGDIVTKTLDYGQKWKITTFWNNYAGTEQTRDYVVQAPAASGNVTVTSSLVRTGSDGTGEVTGGVTIQSLTGYLSAWGKSNGTVVARDTKYFALQPRTFVIGGDTHSCVDFELGGTVIARIDMSNQAAGYGIPAANSSTNSCVITRYGESVPDINLYMNRKDSNNIGLYYGNTQVANYPDAQTTGSVSHSPTIVDGPIGPFSTLSALRTEVGDNSTAAAPDNFTSGDYYGIKVKCGGSTKWYHIRC